MGGLYHKIIMTIASDNHKWTLYLKIIMTIQSTLTLTLASFINYDCKWCSKIVASLIIVIQMTLEASFTIVLCL